MYTVKTHNCVCTVVCSILFLLLYLRQSESLTGRVCLFVFSFMSFFIISKILKAMSYHINVHVLNLKSNWDLKVPHHLWITTSTHQFRNLKKNNRKLWQKFDFRNSYRDRHTYLWEEKKIKKNREAGYPYIYLNSLQISGILLCCSIKQCQRREESN